MDRVLIANRIADNLSWAVLLGNMPKPPELPPIWPRLKRLWPAPVDEFIRGVFEVLLDRPADEEALGWFRQFLINGGSRAEVISHIADTAEARSRCYDMGWLAELELMKPVGIRGALRRIWADPSEQFVHAVYPIVLDRHADPAGMLFFLSFLADGNSRGEMVRLMTVSDEYRNRGIDPGWVEGIDGFSPAGAWAEVCRLNALPDEAFVRGLYVLLFDRYAPGPDELAYHLARLQQGTPREEVIREFAAPPEALDRRSDWSWLDRLPELSGSDRPIDPTPAHTLLTIRDRNEFVARAYQVLLSRVPTESEMLRETRRVRFVPFYRRRLLSRLANSPEAREMARQREDQRLARLFDSQQRSLRTLVERSERTARAEYYRQAEQFKRLADGRTQAAETLVILNEALGRLHETIREQLSQIAAHSVRRDRGIQTTLEGIDRHLMPLARLRDATEALAKAQDHCRDNDKAVLLMVRELRDTQVEMTRQDARILDAIHGLRQAQEELSALQSASYQAMGDSAQREDAIRDAVLHVRHAQDELAQRQEAIRDAVSHLRHAQDDLIILQQRVVSAQDRFVASQQEACQALGDSAQREEAIRDAVSQVRRAQDELAQRGDQVRDALLQLRQVQDDLFTLQQGTLRVQDDLLQTQRAVRIDQERHWFAQDRQLDQLRRYTSLMLPAEESLERGPKVTSTGRCRVCGGELRTRFSRRVLNEKYEAEYAECTDCQALQISNPYWLEEAYSGESRPQLWNPDHGRFVRTFSSCCWLEALRAAKLFPEAPRVLDFGGGYGLLTQMLKDAGYDSWGWDPYVPQPFFSPERAIRELQDVPGDSFDAIVSFEVFEHLTDPIDVGRALRRVLKPEGVLLISTGIYDPTTHGADWNYLSCEAGQHVTFWSKKAVARFAAELGFRSVGHFPGDSGFCILMTHLEPDDLRETLRAASKALRVDGITDRFARTWELTRRGEVLITSEPVVEPTPDRTGDHSHGGKACES